MGLLDGVGYALGAGADVAAAGMMEQFKSLVEQDRQTAMLQVKQHLEESAQARGQQKTAAIIGGVADTVDDPTHPEGARKLTSQEKALATQKAFDEAGRPADGTAFGARANLLRDDERQSKRDDAQATHYADEKEWRAERARIEDEYRKGQLSLQKYQAGISAMNAKRQGDLAQIQIDDANLKKEGRAKVQGLLNAASDVDRSAPGADSATAFYMGEAKRAKEASDMLNGSGVDEKLRYQHVTGVAPDGFTKVERIFDRMAGKYVDGPQDQNPDRGDKFVVGKKYKDASGNVATYRGNGKWD